MENLIKTNHTKGIWTAFKHDIAGFGIFVKDIFNESKNIDKQKVICTFPDYRGDSFTALSKQEMEANSILITAAPELLHETESVRFYAEKSLIALDHKVLSEVRGLLEGIVEKTTSVIKRATQPSESIKADSEEAMNDTVRALSLRHKENILYREDKLIERIELLHRWTKNNDVSLPEFEILLKSCTKEQLEKDRIRRPYSEPSKTHPVRNNPKYPPNDK